MDGDAMTDHDSIHLLHVDDDVEFAELTAEFLERADNRFTVETAPSADDGLDQLTNNDYDCVVSDYEMPGMSGLEFLEAVRKHHPGLPFILFTGQGSEKIASDAISMGVTDYLQKGTGTDQYTLLANRVQNAVARYRAERTRRRHLDAIETAHDGVSVLDENDEFVYVNQAYADTHGYTPEALLGEHWRLVFPDEEYTRVSTEITPQVEAVRYWDGTTTGQRSDGTTFPKDHRITRTEYGEQICTVRDVSEEHRRQKHLSWYQTVIEALDDPVYVLDETGRFEYVNDAFTELVGYDRDRILGASTALIKDEDTVETAEEMLGQLLSSDGPDSIRFETEIHPENGDPIQCEDHMGVLPYEGDSFNGSVGILRDISERNARKEQLERKNAQLEQFTSVVSHDLRNPLNIAEGRLDLAQDECDSPHLDAVERAHDRMHALIEDLLAVARADDTAVDTAPVSLADAADQSWAGVETADAALVTDIDQVIDADESRLKQLLENLMRNAVEHGGDDVTVTVGELPDGFYVADDGPGIPAADRDEIFEAGYSTNDAGTGFGLSIVNQVVDAHGWDVRVTESSDGGARFEVTGVTFELERSE
jgi:PAS domain S-box-containing protein